MFEYFKESGKEVFFVRSSKVCCRETFDMETGMLLVRKYFNLVPGLAAQLPHPTLPDCSPWSSDAPSICSSVFWLSALEVLPEAAAALLVSWGSAHPLPEHLSFETTDFDGYRTDEECEENLSLEVSMVKLGWTSEELRSDVWIKVIDRPPKVNKMVLTDGERPMPSIEAKVSGKKWPHIYCIQGVPMAEEWS